MKVPILLFSLAASGMIFAQAGTIECNTKIAPSLCEMLSKAQSDTQKFIVRVSLTSPPLKVDTGCDGVDPKVEPRCERRFVRDSAYVAQLFSDVRKLFNSFELWYYGNPSHRIPAPSDTTNLSSGFDFWATRPTLIRISQENFVTYMSSLEGVGPATISGRAWKALENQDFPTEKFRADGRKAKVSSKVNLVPLLFRPAP